MCQNTLRVPPGYPWARDRVHKCSYRALWWTGNSSRGGERQEFCSLAEYFTSGLLDSSFCSHSNTGFCCETKHFRSDHENIRNSRCLQKVPCSEPNSQNSSARRFDLYFWKTYVFLFPWHSHGSLRNKPLCHPPPPPSTSPPIPPLLPFSCLGRHPGQIAALRISLKGCWWSTLFQAK